MKKLTHFESNNFHIDSANSILSMLTSSSNLNISFAEQVTSEGLHILNNNLIKFLALRELSLFGLKGNNFTTPDNFLTLPMLRRLSLTCSNFESSSIKKFLQKLPGLAGLEFLDLQSNKLDDSDAQEPGNSLPFLTKLKELELYGNQISDKGVTYLMEKFSLLPKLEKLGLNANNLTPDSCDNIIKAAQEATMARKDGNRLRVDYASNFSILPSELPSLAGNSWILGNDNTIVQPAPNQNS